MDKVIHTDQDLQVVITDNPNVDHPIQMCVEHQDELFGYGLTESQFEQATKILFTLAARTLGTVNLVKHRCPICGLEKFDYIKQTVSVVTPERQNAN